mgnify:CR=1 FL=1
MSNSTKYGLFNSIVGLLIGIHLTFSSIGDGYWIYIIAAPLSIFFCGAFFWNYVTRKFKLSGEGRSSIIGVLTGSVSHYICWVFISIGMNICYLVFGNCKGSSGSPPAQIWEMMFYGIGMTGWSLILYGWITMPCSIGIAILVDRFNKNNA